MSLSDSHTHTQRFVSYTVFMHGVAKALSLARTHARTHACANTHTHAHTETETQRDRQRETETETQRDRDIDRERERVVVVAASAAVVVVHTMFFSRLFKSIPTTAGKSSTIPHTSHSSSL